MKQSLIAPCGMNCSLCIARLRERRNCAGCRGSDEGKSPSCVRCIIRNCEDLQRNGWRFCSDRCGKYPCRRLRDLDRRYRAKYSMSMIENLGLIRKVGIRRFMAREKQRWIKGNSIFCVHDGTYHVAGTSEKR